MNDDALGHLHSSGLQELHLLRMSLGNLPTLGVSGVAFLEDVAGNSHMFGRLSTIVCGCRSDVAYVGVSGAPMDVNISGGSHTLGLKSSICRACFSFMADQKYVIFV